MPVHALKHLAALLVLSSLGPLGCAPHESPPRVVVAGITVPRTIPKEPQHPLASPPPGIPNFGFISKDIWRGGEPSAEGLKTLAALGVKTIIDLREADESAEIPPGVRYIRVPTSSWRADLLNVDKVLKEIAANPKPVFIHCREGRDRTGLAIAAYRLSQDMNADKACEELRNFHVNFWWDGPLEKRIHELEKEKARH